MSFPSKKPSSVRICAPVSAGDALDRCTILSIKASRLDDDTKLAHVLHEREQLILSWDQAGLPRMESFPEWTDLLQVNTQLWDVEDALRTQEHAGDFGAQFIHLARSVYRLNDARFKIKTQLNQTLRSEIVEQKKYAID